MAGTLIFKRKLDRDLMTRGFRCVHVVATVTKKTRNRLYVTWLITMNNVESDKKLFTHRVRLEGYLKRIDGEGFCYAFVPFSEPDFFEGLADFNPQVAKCTEALNQSIIDLGDHHKDMSVVSFYTLN